MVNRFCVSRQLLGIGVLIATAAAATIAAFQIAWAKDGEQMVVETPQPITLEREAKLAGVRRPSAARQDLGTPEELMVRLINVVRQRNGETDGLPPLKRSSLLDAAALAHATAMSDDNFFAHCNPYTLQTPMLRIQGAGYSASVAGESLIAGYEDPWDLVTALTASPDNAVNLEWSEYREVGVGYVYDGFDQATVARDLDGDCIAESTGWGPYYAYWTLVFGSQDGVFPVVIDREAPQTGDRFVDLYIYGEGWASEMRLRNESGAWTAWQPFASEVAWELTPGEGEREVVVEIRNPSGVVRSASDTIHSMDGVASIFSDGFENGDLAAWSEVIG
jgi:uncharacterized protein YkwD